MKNSSERSDAFENYEGPDKPLKQKLKELPVRLRMYWQRLLWRVVNTFKRK